MLQHFIRTIGQTQSTTYFIIVEPTYILYKKFHRYESQKIATDFLEKVKAQRSLRMRKSLQKMRVTHNSIDKFKADFTKTMFSTEGLTRVLEPAIHRSKGYSNKRSVATQTRTRMNFLILIKQVRKKNNHIHLLVFSLYI